MTVKNVMRYEPSGRIFRLFRLLWTKGKVGDGQGYSAKLSVSLEPKRFECKKEHNGWTVTICGVRLHKKISYGGVIV